MLSPMSPIPFSRPAPYARKILLTGPWHSSFLWGYASAWQIQKRMLTVIYFLIYFLIRYFLHLHFQCYLKRPPCPPPTPTSWPWRSPILRHIKFASPMGLSFHWWATRPSSDTYVARDMSSGRYWLVHIVVPPIGLQTPLAPWVLSLVPPLGALWSIQ